MLNEKDKNTLAAYEKQLSTPKFKFILINGLIWGILVVIIMSLIDFFFQHKSLEQQWKEGVLLRILIMPFGGLLYGWLMRMTIERKYKSLKAKDTSG